MQKITVEVEGMVCGMCEAHVNDAIRRTFSVRKVTSSHKKRITEIIAESDIPKDELFRAIEDAGYKALTVKSEVHQKKGLFGR